MKLVLLLIVIVFAGMSCEKEALYLEPCLEMSMLQSNGEIDKRFVAYFVYSLTEENSLFGQGIGDSLRIIDASSIIGKGTYEDEVSLVQFLNNAVCQGEEYIGTYPETFESFLKGSKRLYIYNTRNGQKSGTRESYTDDLDRNITGIRPVRIYTFK
jgi:hypothetical protein